MIISIFRFVPIPFSPSLLIFLLSKGKIFANYTIGGSTTKGNSLEDYQSNLSRRKRNK
jgi:hypothetical protein